MYVIEAFECKDGLRVVFRITPSSFAVVKLFTNGHAASVKWWADADYERTVAFWHVKRQLSDVPKWAERRALMYIREALSEFTAGLKNLEVLCDD
jgi:hypothetical protein